MPSIKKLNNKLPKKSMQTPKIQTDFKKLTKKVALDVSSQQKRNKFEISKSRRSTVGSIKSSTWQKDETKLEQSQTNFLMESLIEETELQKAIEEIESIGSSSELEDIEEIKEELEPDFNLAISEDTKILDFDIDSIEMSLSGEESNSGRQEKVESEQTFFDIFQKVPEVEEISLDLLEEENEVKSHEFKKQLVLTTQQEMKADSGKFLDPVTGLPALDSFSSTHTLSEELLTDEESEVVADDEIESEEQKESLTDDFFIEDRAKSVEDFEKASDLAQDKENLFDMFLQSTKLEEAKINEKEDEDTEIYLREQKRLETKKAVADFLNKLIDHCVAKAEYIESDVILKRSLDKYKLVSELKTTYDLLEFERSRTQYLNRKTVIFLKRKGSFRLITADLPKDLIMQRQNFLTSLNDLDKWLAIEEETKNHNTKRICELRQQFKEVKHESMEKISKLEHLINRTLQRKNFEKLQNLVEKSMRKMSVVRKEISQVRVKLLLEQHQFCSLQKQLEKLEDLGSGLNVRQYESLQTETLAMSKKIQEHDTTLERLHRHFRDDLHKVAHLKEKQNIFKNLIVAQKQFLEECTQKERQLHKHVHQLKLRRNHLKNETKNLLHQTGLLSNQVLLKDYDQTVERANKLRQTNEELKKVIEKLNIKIDKLG